jgi:putative membrane protein
MTSDKMMRQEADRESDREIAAAIAAAETRSAAEIAVAILPRADRYRLTAVLTAVTVFALLYMIATWFEGGLFSAVETIGTGSWLAWPGWVGSVAAVAIATVLFLLCEHTALGVWLTPPAVRREACRARAKLLFLDHGIDATEDRLGVLLSLCKAERQIDILADRGVAAVIPPRKWVELIDGFRRHKGDMELERAVARLIGAVADELAAHFPPWPGQRNELPDQPLRP